MDNTSRRILVDLAHVLCANNANMPRYIGQAQELVNEKPDGGGGEIIH